MFTLPLLRMRVRGNKMAGKILNLVSLKVCTLVAVAMNTLCLPPCRRSQEDFGRLFHSGRAQGENGKARLSTGCTDSFELIMNKASAAMPSLEDQFDR